MRMAQQLKSEVALMERGKRQINLRATRQVAKKHVLSMHASYTVASLLRRTPIKQTTDNLYRWQARNHEQSVTANLFRLGTPLTTWRSVEVVALQKFLPSLDAQVHFCWVHRWCDLATHDFLADYRQPDEPHHFKIVSACKSISDMVEL